MNITIIAGITLGLAVLGATLGVLNTWQNFYRDVLRVTVSPRKAFFKGKEAALCFEIINRSHLPVTISGIGLRLRKPHQHNFFAFIAHTIDGGTLPQRMEPRTSIILFMPPGADGDPLIREASDAFVTTACGRTFRGNSETLKSHIAAIRSATTANDIPPRITYPAQDVAPSLRNDPGKC